MKLLYGTLSFILPLRVSLPFPPLKPYWIIGFVYFKFFFLTLPTYWSLCFCLCTCLSVTHSTYPLQLPTSRCWSSSVLQLKLFCCFLKSFQWKKLFSFHSESSEWEAKFYQIQSKYLLLLNELHNPQVVNFIIYERNNPLWPIL